MPDDNPSSSRWIAHAQELAKLFATAAGILSVFMLLAVGWSTGWLPFAPIDKLVKSMEKGNLAGRADAKDIRELIQQLREVARATQNIVEQQNLRNKLADCDHLKDVELRRRCAP